MTASEEAGGSLEVNPYVAGAELLAPVLAPARPRVWTTFAALGAALGTIVVSQVIFGIAIGISCFVVLLRMITRPTEYPVDVVLED